MKDVLVRPLSSRGKRVAISSLSGLVVLLLVCDGTQAALVTHPYWGFTSKTFTVSQVTDCGLVKFAQPASFGKRAGVLRASGTVRAPNCPNATGQNGATWSTEDVLSHNFSFKRTTSTYYVDALWDLKFIEAWAYHPYSKCSLNTSVSLSVCQSSAAAGISLWPFLTDLSNSSWGAGGAYAGTGFMSSGYGAWEDSSQRSCSATKCTVTYYNITTGRIAGATSLNRTIGLNMSFAPGSINPADKFQLQIEIFAQIDAYAFVESAVGVGLAHADASINLGPGGHAATLLSLSYS